MNIYIFQNNIYFRSDFLSFFEAIDKFFFFIRAYNFSVYLITCVHKFYELHLNFFNYKNTLKKPTYIIFFIKNKNI